MLETTLEECGYSSTNDTIAWVKTVLILGMWRDNGRAWVHEADFSV
jgi:hypothetical protein